MGVGQYLGPDFVGGLNAPHYLDGRLLVAQDLRDERGAALTRLGWLGQAAGAGVIAGFTVQPQGAAAVQVLGGQGITPAGTLLSFSGAVSLPLVAGADSTPAAPPDLAGLGRFSACDLPAGGGTTGLAAGAYLLTVVPAQKLDGLAPTAALGGVSGGCEPRWDVAGLRFRALRLDDFEAVARDAADARRRNLLAHWCFGSARLPDLPLDPFTFPERFDGLGSLADLTSDDLPLAVFDWTGSALRSTDLWSARRRLVRPFALTAWGGLLADLRAALGQARFLQFQDQLAAELAHNANPAARALFRYLPPAGFLPIRLSATLLRPFITQAVRALVALIRGRANSALAERLAALLAELLQQLEQQALERALAGADASGVDLATFFEGARPQRLGLLDPDSVDFVVQRSWYDEAIDLDGNPSIDLLLPGDILAAFAAAAVLDVAESRLADALRSARGQTLLDLLGGADASPLLAAGERLRLARAEQTMRVQRLRRRFRLRVMTEAPQATVSARLAEAVRARYGAAEPDADAGGASGAATDSGADLLSRLNAWLAKPYVLFVKRIRPTAWFDLGGKD